MQLTRFLAPALLGAALLAACADSPTAAPAISPEPEGPRALGLVEIQISGIGTPQMTASVAPLGGARGDLRTVPGGTPAGSLQLSRLSASTVDAGTRGAGGERFIHVVFRVRNADGAGNAYATPRQNLTFLPVSTSSTLAGSPVRSFLKQDGTPADPAMAAGMRPTGAVALNQSGELVSQYPDVLQAYTEAEVAAVPMPAAVTNRFAYGFVARHATASNTRTLPANPAPDQFDGRVTFSFRLPLAATSAQDAFSISIVTLAVDDTETRVTQSLEEQSVLGRAWFENRVTALGATGVTIFPGGGYTGAATRRMLCGVRTAGSVGSATASLSPCADIASVVVTPGSATRVVGQTLQLSAAATDVNGNAADWVSVQWSSSNTAAATVSETGLVTFVGLGTATITATAGGRSGTAALTSEPILDESITTGNAHSCGLTTSGAAYCWGNNAQGQLGDGTTTSRNAPVAVAGGRTYKSISANGDFTVALTSAGVAYAWGDNGTGQLGDGSTSVRISPVAVSTQLRFSSVSAGGSHTVALTSDGTAYAWGHNSLGQLGNGTTTSRTTPAQVSGTTKFTRIRAGGSHTVALTAAGVAYAWGNGNWGMLGDGSNTSSSTPVLVSGGLKFVRVSAGPNHTMALTAEGVAYGWGLNEYGQLGDGSLSQRTVPTQVSGELTFRSIEVGANHTVAVTEAGAAYAWGHNFWGQLGDGTGNTRTAPVPVVGGHVFTEVSAGGNHTLAITATGSGYSWGANTSGQLGNPVSGSSREPVAVAGELTFARP